MPLFTYKAINADGSTMTGTMEATDVEAVQNILAQQGHIPTAVTRAKGAPEEKLSVLAQLGGVKLPDLLMFTKQVNTLLKAGIPITRTFEVLEEQTDNPLLRQTIKSLNKDVNQGSSLTRAFSQHPKIFPKLYCSLVHAGEVSGSLPEVLVRLTFILDHEHKVREDVKSALAYPKMVLFALVGAFFFLLTFVIPKFATVFEKANLELPLPTKICIALYSLINLYWPLLIGGAAGLVLLIRFYFKTAQGALVKDNLLLRLPIVGPLFVKTAMSRFASILAILLSSGVSILDSLNIISESLGNVAISREFDRIKEQMKEGSGISSPLRKATLFPPMVVNMIAIGEESGSLDDMLREVASHYDEEVEYAVKGLSESIGPILIVGLTAVVGFFALAIFLPMWDLTKMAK